MTTARLSQLRSVTTTLHHHLEESFFPEFATHRRIHPEEYYFFLQVMHAFYTNLYLKSSHFTSSTFHLPVEDHVNALHKEIKQFHLSSSHETLRCPDCKDEADLLGISYVLEGSQLGGAVIRKVIRQQAWFYDELQFFYLRGTSESLGAGWRNFLEVLENTPLSAEQEIRLQMSAIDTFLCLEHLMKQLRNLTLVPVEIAQKAS